MPKPNQKREDRITMEIVVDAYDEVERVVAWYCYLKDRIRLFTARCIARREISPLQVGDEVDVLRMAKKKECGHEMFVVIKWERDGLAVPLSQIKPLADTEPETKQAVEDWHYWVKMGYQF